MAQVEFYFVEDDTSPNLEFAVKRGGTAINLTDAQKVELKIHSTVTGQITNATQASDDDCAIQSASEGTVTYDIKASDFAHPGVYLCDLVITWDNGEVETQPDYVYVHIRPKGGTVS